MIAYMVKQNQNFFEYIPAGAFIACCAVVWFFATMLVYRISLLDVHETSRLLFYRLLAKVIGLALVENIEYIIYRAKLSFHETDRLEINTQEIKKFLIFIEDRQFYSHNGINYRSIARGILSLIKIKPRSGGSTIVQQVIRTLFISDLQKTYRRKFIELSLAPWLTNTFSKDTILNIYISAVRFERGCFGIVEAMEYFWCKVEKNPNNAQAFFLIERVSNVRSRLLVPKILETAKSAKNKGLMDESDLHDLIFLYEEAVSNNKIIASSDQLKVLRDSLRG
ncbi:biosynthetic peptidoglycan transglycosylase [Halomonas sp. CSM-2]|uniref:biosynthetic peptidoglycan transglycosylase n=1 Tax=Halomonas sp. CSM-2 TaxID=1975722 RepID=UPI001C38DD47|nr:biosynthetic peptidoglycan transglycosylase [Halomonas sp. CSM-2]